MAIVLDACAIAKTFLDEEHSAALRSFLKEQIGEDEDLAAPRLIAYELGNIIGAQFADEDLRSQRQILDDALRLVRVLPLDEPGDALRFVPDTGSFYDAAYLRAARSEDAGLVTYDRTLRTAARTHGVPVLKPV